MLLNGQRQKQITTSGNQIANSISRSLLQEERKESFELIWFYCYLKNFQGKNITKELASAKKEKKSPLKERQSTNIERLTLTQDNQPLTWQRIQHLVQPLRQTYQLQTIQTQLQHSLNAIKQRVLLSRNDRFFVIQPQKEITQIERMLRLSSLNLKKDLPLQTCLEELIIELYSYYLNSKNVYLIYKSSPSDKKLLNNQRFDNNSISSSIDSAENRLKMMLTHNSSQSRLNTSKDSKGSLQRNERKSYGSLKSSFILPTNNPLITNKLLEEDSILMLGNIGNESFITDGQKMDNKIEEMQVIDKFGQFDGLQLWNIKYKKIPHTFVKFKKQSWTKSLNLPLMHPSAPKTINEYPIIPRITKLNPHIDKLLPFVSFMKMLETYFPNLLPSIDSIFEYNGMPYIFLQQDNGYGSWKWETNIGVLCYFVVYGNDEETLSIKKVQRWVQQNPYTLLARTIKQMTKRQKEKGRKRKELIKTMSSINGNNTNNTHTNTNATNLSNESALVNSVSGLALQMLITKDETSDLAIW